MFGAVMDGLAIRPTKKIMQRWGHLFCYLSLAANETLGLSEMAFNSKSERLLYALFIIPPVTGIAVGLWAADSFGIGRWIGAFCGLGIGFGASVAVTALLLVISAFSVSFSRSRKKRNGIGSDPD